MFHPNGKRGRQNIALASSGAALTFLLSDLKQVQEGLGFDFSGNRRIVKFIIGGWLFASSLISMSLCHRLDSSRSKKIEPFLRRDELSPVGWIVPSIPNIVIDPKLSRNKMITPQFFLKKKKDDKDMGPGHTNNTVYCSEDNKMLGLGGKNDEGQAKLDGYAPPPSIGPSNSLKIKKNNTYEKYLIKNNYHAPTKNPAH